MGTLLPRPRDIAEIRRSSPPEAAPEPELEEEEDEDEDKPTLRSRKKYKTA